MQNIYGSCPPFENETAVSHTDTSSDCRTSVSPALTTNRLCIRRIRSEDWKAVQAIWADEASSPYAVYDRPNATDDASVRSRIEKWAAFADSREHLFFAVCLENTVIGYAAFHKRSDGYELGYCFHSAYHAKGYAKESISALIGELKKRGICRVTAGTALKNIPSVRLLTSLGFRLAGTEKVSFCRDAEGSAIVFDGGIYELLL